MHCKCIETFFDQQYNLRIQDCFKKDESLNVNKLLSSFHLDVLLFELMKLKSSIEVKDHHNTACIVTRQQQ